MPAYSRTLFKAHGNVTGRAHEQTTDAAQKDLEMAVQRSELRFVECASVLDGYPSVLEQIGQAIVRTLFGPWCSSMAHQHAQTLYSEAKEEFNARAVREYDRVRLHEGQVVQYAEHNRSIEAELESLQQRVVEHAEMTSALEDEAVEAYAKLLAELEESEVRHDQVFTF